MSHDERMTDVLSEFALSVMPDFSVQETLEHLVHRIVDVLPVDGAGVTMASASSGSQLIAASDEVALRFETLQTELGEGPRFAVHLSNEAVALPDLTQDGAFPRCSVLALREGLRAVFTFPLRDSDRVVGALDLYRTAAGSLTPSHMASAQRLADVSSAYLLNARARVEAASAAAAERADLVALRGADRERTEFVATIIHELRTPMTSIRGYAEMLQDASTGALNATQVQLVEAIDRNSDRLAALADDLLLIVRLEQVPVRRDHISVDLCAVVRGAAGALAGLIDGRRLDVTFDVPEAALVIDGDARHLERLVMNLMTNAIKFTEDGGWVRCRLRETAGCARIEISDNGIGIPESEQARLFTKFFRASTAKRRQTPGSGLGLSIVRSITHDHGGEMSMTSTVGHGTTVLVDLPIPVAGPERGDNANRNR